MGTIQISGIDVSQRPQEVRRLCGYVPQEVSVDGDLTGYENLLFYSRLYSIPHSESSRRIRDALEFMQVTDRANDLVKTYSGGMMRRLEIGQVLVNRPQVLFLDEPSIGLDQAAKHMIWDYVTRLRDEFRTTILLTTHDMLEADELCNRIAIMNGGKISVIGSPEELKEKLGGDVISLTVSDQNAVAILEELGYRLLAHQHDGVIDIVAENGEHVIPHIVEELKNRGITTESVSLKRGTLDDVFLQYAGKRIGESEPEWKSVRATRRAATRLGK